MNTLRSSRSEKHTICGTLTQLCALYVTHTRGAIMFSFIHENSEKKLLAAFAKCSSYSSSDGDRRGICHIVPLT